MRKGMRFGFTVAEKAELWDRWRRGEFLHEIGLAFGKRSSSVMGNWRVMGKSVLYPDAARGWR